MEIFKSLEEKVDYVETLTALATAGEKITETKKTFIYDIVKKYGIPEKYVDRIWDKVKRKYDLEEILSLMIEKDINLRTLLVQELVFIFLLSGRYKDEKSRLIQICQILKINIKLEAIKENVQKIIKEHENK